MSPPPLPPQATARSTVANAAIELRIALLVMVVSWSRAGVPPAAGDSVTTRSKRTTPPAIGLTGGIGMIFPQTHFQITYDLRCRPRATTAERVVVRRRHCGILDRR